MRHSILGFNQQKAVELNLTTNDLLLLQYIMYANSVPTMKHIVEDEISYVWLQHEKVQEDLPILNISEGTLRNKLSDFRNRNLIESKTIANTVGRGSRTYYAITELTMSLINDVENTTMSSENDVEQRPRHSKITSNKELINDIENKSFSKEKEEISEYDSHMYSPEELKNDFLGSSRRKVSTRPRKQSLYSKCVAEINIFTQELQLHDLLVKYLNLRLEMKDKPLYANQWKGMLNKLADIIKDNPGMSYEDVVRQSIDRGYASFFPVNSYSKGKNVFAEGNGLSCEQSEETEEERKESLRRSGRRSEF